MGSTLTANRVAPESLDAPLWSWANLLSLDAVTIGLLWQLVFTLQFCDRTPSYAESAIVGLAIWLAYTGDRLLDSLRLDLSRPHALRHRIHLEYRVSLVAAWVVALTIATTLIVFCATDSQLRWGYAGVAIVLAYVAGVHFARESRWWLPKELQAGMVLAMGVSLLPWSEVSDAHRLPLLLTTLMAGFLFASNCYAVACWEHDLDSQQGFASWVTRYPASPRWLPITLISHLAITALMFALQLIPPLITTCLIVSNVLMLVVVMANRDCDVVARGKVTSLASPSALGAMTDAALVIPPMMLGVCAAL